MKILIVDDDRDLVDLLTFALRRAGYETVPAYDGPGALQVWEREDPDLIVLDVNLGSSSGFDILRLIRRRNMVPVIMLTARDAEDDKVHGLELGADDYVTKPFSHRELIARIRATARRHSEGWAPTQTTESLLSVGPLTLNLAEHSATKNGELLDLTVTEFRLLRYLMGNAGSTIPLRIILRQVWGYDDPRGRDVVRVTVHRLRRKIEDDPSTPRFLHTVPGVGFMLKAS